MLLFIITIILAVVFSVLAFIWKDACWGSWERDASMWCYVLQSFLWCAVVIMIIISFVFNSNLEGQIAEKKETYESLVYQLENNLYDNDNDLGKKELYDQITEWNTDVVWYKSMQDNIWIGMFYADIWTDLEPIELGG